ncbi:hypothetical protein [Candidatus Lokiarchaeum ossiferum]|uniref:hypothetical protein n=1 Tax=Candidatus Lokiarchaeum ossiferum TaxID=2951803 RepID=UPI00352BEBE5
MYYQKAKRNLLVLVILFSFPLCLNQVICIDAALEEGVDFSNLSLTYHSSSINFGVFNGTEIDDKIPKDVFFILEFTEQSGEIGLNLTLDIKNKTTNESIYHKSNSYLFDPTSYIVSNLNKTEIGIMPFMIPIDEPEIGDQIIFSKHGDLTNIAEYVLFDTYIQEVNEEDRFYDAFLIRYHYSFSTSSIEVREANSVFYYEKDTHFLLQAFPAIFLSPFLKAEFGEFLIIDFIDPFTLDPLDYPFEYETLSPVREFFSLNEQYFVNGGIGFLIVCITSIMIVKKKKDQKSNRTFTENQEN